VLRTVIQFRWGIIMTFPVQVRLGEWQPALYGNYTCLAKNQHGYTSKDVRLREACEYSCSIYSVQCWALQRNWRYVCARFITVSEDIYNSLQILLNNTPTFVLYLSAVTTHKSIFCITIYWDARTFMATETQLKFIWETQ